MAADYKELSYIFRYIRRYLAKLLFRFIGTVSPRKGKLIVFDSMNGKQYSCNPRAIYEYMAEHYDDPELRFVWAFRDPEKYAFLVHDPRTVICRYNSFRYFYYCCISDAVVFNFGWPFADRKGQIRLQTWHGGGCYKKIGLAMNYNTNARNWFARTKMKDITHFISSSRYFTEEVIRKQYDFHGPVLSIGMPRNDVLVKGAYTADKVHDIKQSIGLADDEYVILYAPTYDQLNLTSVEILDSVRLKRAVQVRFGKKPVFLYRGHHYSEESGAVRYDLDVTEYPDMKDILEITDLLITNYSSSIWDYSFTGRPCFLYTPDLKEYVEYRGLDKDIHEWGFPVCETNDQLEESIVSFDYESYHAAMRRHHEELGSFETGEAAEKSCAFLAESIGICQNGR